MSKRYVDSSGNVYKKDFTGKYKDFWGNRYTLVSTPFNGLYGFIGCALIIGAIGYWAYRNPETASIAASLITCAVTLIAGLVSRKSRNFVTPAALSISLMTGSYGFYMYSTGSRISWYTILVIIVFMFYAASFISMRKKLTIFFFLLCIAMFGYALYAEIPWMVSRLRREWDLRYIFGLLALPLAALILFLFPFMYHRGFLRTGRRLLSIIPAIAVGALYAVFRYYIGEPGITLCDVDMALFLLSYIVVFALMHGKGAAAWLIGFLPAVLALIANGGFPLFLYGLRSVLFQPSSIQTYFSDADELLLMAMMLSGFTMVGIYLREKKSWRLQNNELSKEMRRTYGLEDEDGNEVKTPEAEAFEALVTKKAGESLRILQDGGYIPAADNGEDN